MAEPFMPALSIVVPVHCETEWLGHLQLQPVHAVLGPLHLGEKAVLAIPDPQYSALNQYVWASFVHLPNANDCVLQARDPVHSRQDLVLAVALGEDDGALAADVDHGAISELDGTLHRPVKLGEHVSMACHVVCCARVEVPTLKAVVVARARAEVRLSLGLVQVDQLLLLWWRLDDL
jgi:hypothetical protein